MLKTNWIVAAALLSACFPNIAGAVIVVVDPADFAVGTDLSNAYDGLTMSRLTRSGGSPNEPVASPVTAGSQCNYGDLPCLGGYYYINNWVTCYSRIRQGLTSGACGGDPWSVLELVFDVPTNLVQVTASWGSDSPGMLAFDSLGNEVGRCWSVFGSLGDCITTISREPAPHGNVMALTFDSADANISRVIIAGVAGNVGVNEILYRHSVPEPGTIGLLVLGLAGIGVLGRKGVPSAA